MDKKLIDAKRLKNKIQQMIDNGGGPDLHAVLTHIDDLEEQIPEAAQPVDKVTKAPVDSSHSQDAEKKTAAQILSKHTGRSIENVMKSDAVKNDEILCTTDVLKAMEEYASQFTSVSSYSDKDVQDKTYSIIHEEITQARIKIDPMLNDHKNYNNADDIIADSVDKIFEKLAAQSSPVEAAQDIINLKK